MGLIRIEILMLRGLLTASDVEELLGHSLSVKDDIMISLLINYAREYSLQINEGTVIKNLNGWLQWQKTIVSEDFNGQTNYRFY